MKLLVETIGHHNCIGFDESLPPVVQRFATESGAEVEHRVYRAWDLGEDVPAHVQEKLAEVRAGRASGGGFFVNGRWLPASPHNAEEAVTARQALAVACNLPPEPADVAWSGRALDRLALETGVVETVFLGGNKVTELGAYLNQFERVWFFDGAIKTLSVDCPVEQFRFAGCDLNKLVEIANQHPDLFREARLSTAEPGDGKAAVEDVTIRLLTAEDLSSGVHPCAMSGGEVDTGHSLHRAAAARFGGWGYVAEHKGRPCEFLGIAPKDAAQACMLEFLPPGGDAAAEETLLLNCLAGGGVFDPAYDRIGVGTALVRRAMADARARGYRCIEANPHDPSVGPFLERCGFTRIEWPARGHSPQLEPAFYRPDLGAPGVEPPVCTAGNSGKR